MCVRSRFCLHVGLHFIPFNLICNMTTFREDKYLTFDPTTGVEGVCKDRIFLFMMLYAPFPLIWYATRLLSEKDVLTFWPHLRGQGCVYGQNIFYHVTACVAPFNLICSKTIFRKSWILASTTPPKSTQGDQSQAFKIKFRLKCFTSIVPLPACKISVKNIGKWLKYCEI